MSKLESQANRTQPELDPVFVSSRREALIIVAVWFAALCWCVPYCYLTGYGKPVDAATLETVFGVPKWIFWGIAVPWLVADAFTIVFCLFVMRDDDLGVAAVSDQDRPDGSDTA